MSPRSHERVKVMSGKALAAGVGCFNEAAFLRTRKELWLLARYFGGFPAVLRVVVEFHSLRLGLFEGLLRFTRRFAALRAVPGFS